MNSQPTKQDMMNEVSRHAYDGYCNPFGMKLTAQTLEGKYAEIQERLAEREAEAAAFRAKMMALYA